MSLWEWALDAYQHPGVSEECLALQDRHGQSVAFLLWAVWAAPDSATLELGAAITRRWEASVLQPLRAVRGGLTAPAPPVDDKNRVELREEVISVELLAERVLLETLEGLAPKSERDALESLIAASCAWTRSAPREALSKLAAAIS